MESRTFPTSAVGQRNPRRGVQSGPALSGRPLDFFARQKGGAVTLGWIDECRLCFG
ncbi:hypothetical protein EMIT0196P_210047 [Pseudomonas chlororaphis]